MNYQIPFRRKLLVEKFEEDKLEIDNDRYILDILDKKDKVINSFVVMLDGPPMMTLIELPGGVMPGIYTFDKRIKWEPMDIYFLENIGKSEKRKILKWIHLKEHFPLNINLYRSYTNGLKTSEKVSLYGCINTALFDSYGFVSPRDRGIGITIEFNYCTMSWE